MPSSIDSSPDINLETRHFIVTNNSSSSPSSESRASSSSTILTLYPTPGGKQSSPELQSVNMRVSQQSPPSRPPALPVDYVAAATTVEIGSLIPFSQGGYVTTNDHPRRDLGSRGGIDARYMRRMLAKLLEEHGVNDPQLFENLQIAAEYLVRETNAVDGDGIGNWLTVIEFFAFLFEAGHAIFGYKNIFDFLSQICEVLSCLAAIFSAFLIWKHLGTIGKQADKTVEGANYGPSKEIAEKSRAYVLEEVKEQRNVIPPTVIASFARSLAASGISFIEWKRLNKISNLNSTTFWAECVSQTILILTGLVILKFKRQEAEEASKASKREKDIVEKCEQVEKTTPFPQVTTSIKNYQSPRDTWIKGQIFHCSWLATAGESALSFIRLLQGIFAYRLLQSFLTSQQSSLAAVGGNQTHLINGSYTTSATTTEERNLLNTLFLVVNTVTITMIVVGLFASALNILVNALRAKLDQGRLAALKDELIQIIRNFQHSEKSNLAPEHLKQAEAEIRKAFEPHLDGYVDAPNNFYGEVNFADSKETDPLNQESLEQEPKFYDAEEQLSPGEQTYVINNIFSPYFPSDEVIEPLNDFNNQDLLGLVKNNPQFFNRRTLKENLEKILPPLAAFDAVGRIAEKIIENDPNRAVEYLVHVFKTDFRGQKEEIIKLLELFGISREDIEKFIRALNEDPSAEEVVRQTLARHLNVMKTVF